MATYPLLFQDGLHYFLDSCSHYAAADVGRKYAVVQGTPQLTAGRTVGNALRFDGGSTSVEHAFLRGGDFVWLTWGASVYVDSTTWGATTSICLSQAIKDETASAGVRVELTQLRLTSAGALALTDPTSTIVQSADGVVPFDAWCFIEWSVVVNDATAAPNTGSCSARVNANVVATASSTNTAGAVVDPEIHRCRFGNQDAANAVRVDICDIYIHSANTGATAFLGYRPVVVYAPTANGTFIGLTPFGAATNVEAVDDVPADLDTSYVRGDGTGSPTDTYRFDSAPITPTDTPGGFVPFANGQMVYLGRAESGTATASFAALTPSFVSDTMVTWETDYFYAFEIIARTSVAHQYGIGTGADTARVSQVVLEQRGFAAARSWVGWLGPG